MKLSSAIDLYLEDMCGQGRITSKRSEDSYRASLLCLAEDVSNRDPRYVGREDVKGTLARWPNPNTKARNRSMFISFFSWMEEEGLRKDNPARQTPRPKQRRPQVYRMTLEEVGRFLAAAQTTRERRIAYLGVCAGLRREELRLLQGRHLARLGWVWVSPDIAKGGRERWVPVLPELVPVIEEILREVGPEEFVLPSQRTIDVGTNQRFVADSSRASDGKVIWRAVKRIGDRAGITAGIGTHTMRHAFADHVARYAGLRSAQMMLGHAALSTTEGYLGVPTLDELAASVEGVRFVSEALPPDESPQSQSWRRWESNPRIGPSSATSGLGLSAALMALFESSRLQAAAREMAA